MNSAYTKEIVAFVVASCLVLASPAVARAQLSSLPSQPWPQKPVTISFPPDFVEIGRYRNELFQHLNSQLGYPEWKIEILRAFQTWARHSDVTFAVVPDSARAFGIPGLAQGDPRFGDIRIGAFPQDNVLGNAVPYHPSAGVWAGDIFLDTTRKFYRHDGSGSGSFNEYDLYSVLLHEVGNSLGLLDEELDPESVMFFAYLGARQDLSELDIDNIQRLYGPPSSDPWEQNSTNDDFANATPIVYGSDFSNSLVEARSGRIQQGSDVDCFRFSGNSLSENCWIKLRAQGKSLLCGRITVYDASFQEIASISAVDPLQNSVGKEITGINPGEVIYVSIDWSGYPDFDFGDYELAIDFNENAGSEFDQPNDDDGDPPGLFEADDEALVDALYSQQGPIDLETNANNTFATAVELFTSFGSPMGSRFEVISSLATPADIDLYRIRTASDATGTLVVDLTPLGLDPAAMNVVLFDRARQPVAVTRRTRITRDVVIEANNIMPNTDYYLRVQSQRGNELAGNYLLMANVATRSTNLQRIERVALSATGADQFGDFTTFKTQLFRFDLGMTSRDTTNQACQFTIYSDTGRVELVTSVRASGKRTAYVWLQAGRHHFRFNAVTRNNRPIVPSIVTLDGASISDDEGPILLDPSGNPISGPQQPGSNPTPPPRWQFPRFLVGLVIPPENPW
ncbi:MAG: matrixin family metalloprotease [Planctomycetaceae bacterium]|nr:matrixin family metalloprotease [Planctomycetaceae bacterium]